ncbi:GTPase Der [Striga asiatica]|uniref:GTPase Der n=1 Tax=Striga asiatica TaxID=4170 RepID=A0A5A7PZJ2_STRAF|nr:GTPase Der [Striga asiatica]
MKGTRTELPSIRKNSRSLVIISWNGLTQSIEQGGSICSIRPFVFSSTHAFASFSTSLAYSVALQDSTTNSLKAGFKVCLRSTQTPLANDKRGPHKDPLSFNIGVKSCESSNSSSLMDLDRRKLRSWFRVGPLDPNAVMLKAMCTSKGENTKLPFLLSPVDMNCSASFKEKSVCLATA